VRDQVEHGDAPKGSENNDAQRLASSADPIEVEHILHDGGSTDGTLDFLSSVDGIRWGTGKDDGMYDAINRCWKQGSGDVFSYLNCDEQYLPDTLSKVASFFDAHPEIDLLFGDAILLDKSGRPFSYRRIVSPLRAHTRSVHLGTMSCSMFFRRRLFEKGLFFDTRWRAIGDAEWVYRALGAGAGVSTIREPLAAFAFTESNLGSNPKALAEADRWGRESSSHWLKPVLKSQHWLRKLCAGAYMPKTLTISVYSPGSQVRTGYPNTQLSHRWSNG
jgi:glycosyltransferase involved in cell wall biosynthesis